MLDYLKIDRAAVVGWSDGAITGLQLAISEPDRVSRLFAFGANSSLDGFKTKRCQEPSFFIVRRPLQKRISLLSPHPERVAQTLVEGLRRMWRTEPTSTSRSLRLLRVPDHCLGRRIR